MIALEPSTWQQTAIDGIARALGRRNSPRAALLQLPTGFGKSLVAVRVFQRLKRKHPTLRLIVVLQKQNVPAGWKRALGFSNHEKIPLFQPMRIKFLPGVVSFHTRLELKRALEPNRGWPSALARELTSVPHLVVVDEVHRHRGFLEKYSRLFESKERSDRAIAERNLSSPFRNPARGRRSWPKWLLLSATPINPVSLDLIDPLDCGKSDNTYDEGEELRDAEVLANALETTHGALAGLSGLEYGDWFAQYVLRVKARLSQPVITQRIEAPRHLTIWPRNLRSRHLRPRSTRRWQCGKVCVSETRLKSAISQVARTAQAIESAPGNAVRRRATAERLVLSGGLLRTKGSSIQGEPYSASLVRSVEAAGRRLRRSGVARPEKLDALIALVESVGEEHVLVFCVHRAVAQAVSQILKRSLGSASVRTAIGKIDDNTVDWFNDTESNQIRVVVATDACSESIDLHERANILVHYELPWSPLRVLQRVGRLWRLRRVEIHEGRKPYRPRLPGVVHFAHPGSVDEEILSRLHRRWGYLRALGLDYLSYTQALGTRLPPVPWQRASSA